MSLGRVAEEELGDDEAVEELGLDLFAPFLGQDLAAGVEVGLELEEGLVQFAALDLDPLAADEDVVGKDLAGGSGGGGRLGGSILGGGGGRGGGEGEGEGDNGPRAKQGQHSGLHFSSVIGIGIGLAGSGPAGIWQCVTGRGGLQPDN